MKAIKQSILCVLILFTFAHCGGGEDENVNEGTSRNISISEELITKKTFHLHAEDFKKIGNQCFLDAWGIPLSSDSFAGYTPLLYSSSLTVEITEHYFTVYDSTRKQFTGIWNEAGKDSVEVDTSTTYPVILHLDIDGDNLRFNLTDDSLNHQAGCRI